MAGDTPKRWFLQNANLFDGERPAVPHSTVVVEGERIAAVTQGAGPDPGPEDRVVDVAGRTLMPGLTSCHFHTMFDNVSPMSAVSLGLQAPPTYLALVAGKNAGIAIDCGVTQVLCASTTKSIDSALKQAILDGVVPGPRVVCGSHELMTSSDLVSGTSRNYYMELGNKGVVRTCNAGPDAWREVVRDEIGHGAEIVKLSLSQGHNAGPATGGVNLTPAEIDAVVSAAHTHGVRVRAHAATKLAILECARAGVDIIDHADRMDTECIDAVVEAGCFVVPSLLYLARVVDGYDAGYFDTIFQGRPPGMLTATMEDMRASTDAVARWLPEAQRAGVKLLAGDDFGTYALAHGEYGKELSFYVKHVGIAPLDVLRWATSTPAYVMGMEAELGTVAEGKLADLIAVDGDPLVDISCLEDPARIPLVMKGGVAVKDLL